MADIAEIKELAKALNLMNVYNGIIDISDEKVSNLDYLYHRQQHFKHCHQQCRFVRSCLRIFLRRVRLGRRKERRSVLYATFCR